MDRRLYLLHRGFAAMSAPITEAGSKICTVRGCSIHGKPAGLVKYNRDGSVSINLKRYLRWFLRQVKAEIKPQGNFK
jgi:hypothetical protein